MRDLHRRRGHDSCGRGLASGPREATTAPRPAPAPAGAGAHRPAGAGAHRPAVAVAAGVAAAVMLASCAGEQPATTLTDDGDTPPPVTPTAVTPPPATPTVEPDESTPTPDEAGSTRGAASQDVAPGEPVTLGETVIVADLELTASVPEPYSPSLYAVGHEHDHAVAVEFRVVNHGTEPWDPAGWLATMRSADLEAPAIYDDSLDSPPLTPLPPGSDAVWTQAWSVADPDDLDLRVTSSLTDSTQ